MEYAMYWKKKFKNLFLIIFLFFNVISIQAQEFVLNQHYSEIDNAVPSHKKNVVQFFSLYCPACYLYEKNIIPIVLNHIDTDIQLKQYYLNLHGSPQEDLLASAYAVAEVYKIGDKVKADLFALIQDQRKKIYTEEQIYPVFEKYNISTEDYKKTTHSFIVNLKIKEWYNLKEKAKINAIPSFIVNEKYIINTSKLANLMELPHIINYLANKDKIKSDEQMLPIENEK